MTGTSLKQRFYDPAIVEEMDRPDISREVLTRDLENLRIINRYFGGLGAANFACNLALRDEPVASFLDCACGGGDLTLLQNHRLRPAISRAIDLHPVTLELARKHTAGSGIEFETGDLRCLPFPDASFDVVTCHLALHHFPDNEAVDVLRELGRVARKLVVVTDLSRDVWGYRGVWLLVHLWLREPVTRHDALLSVRRAWNHTEFAGLAEQAGWLKPRHRPLPWFRQALWWEKST
jgi:SAM-dependent methyltransferase